LSPIDAEKGDSYVDELVNECADLLPFLEAMPELSAAEVEKFVQLGRFGRQALRTGNVELARQAHLSQIGIFPGNWEPYVDLARLEAGQGEREPALGYLRDAVVRGFRDLRSLERSEAWVGIGRPAKYLKLIDALPEMDKRAADWPAWDRIEFRTPPQSLGVALDRQRRVKRRIDAMSPALGPALTVAWNRLIDRMTATHIETYVLAGPEAGDFESAVETLLALYGEGPLESWERRGADISKRLIRVSEILLERYPESPMRAQALVALAVGNNAVRDKKNALHPVAAKRIRGALSEVLATGEDSPVLPTAVVGLVRTEDETAGRAAAAEVYERFRRVRAADDERLVAVREGLGELALHLGGVPEFTVKALDGSTLDREALDGKVAIVDFWATWCGPCLDEMPALRRLGERYGDDVVLVGINLNEPDDLPLEGLQEWIQGRDVPGVQIHDGQAWESNLVRDFGVKEIPFNVVVGADGEVLAVNAHGKQLEKAVKAAIRRRAAG
jgi:thiol-disulfide isomerase/thioredoxin